MRYRLVPAAQVGLGNGLAEAIARALEVHPAIPVDVADLRADPEVERVAYFVVTAAVGNAIKYAGPDAAVSVTIASTDDPEGGPTAGGGRGPSQLACLTGRDGQSTEFHGAIALPLGQGVVQGRRLLREAGRGKRGTRVPADAELLGESMQLILWCPWCPWCPWIRRAGSGGGAAEPSQCDTATVAAVALWHCDGCGPGSGAGSGWRTWLPGPVFPVGTGSRGQPAILTARTMTTATSAIIATSIRNPRTIPMTMEDLSGLRRFPGGGGGGSSRRRSGRARPWPTARRGAPSSPG
jgi:hypothetical protein